MAVRGNFMTYTLRSCELFYILYLISFTTKYAIQYVQDELTLVTIINYRQRRTLLPIPLSGIWNRRNCSQRILCLKINISATYCKVPFLIVSPDTVFLTAGFLSQISKGSLKCTLNLATVAPFHVFPFHYLPNVIPFEPT